MKKKVLMIAFLILLIFSLFIFKFYTSEASLIKKYKDEDVRSEYYIDNEIILNEISDFLSKNRDVEEIKKSKFCYQNNCKQIGDYIVIGNYDGKINDIVEKMSQINLYSAMKVFDENNIDVLYNYLSLVSTHSYFIAYKKCVSELCSVEDEYYEKQINNKYFYYKENKINNDWSTIYTNIPSL